MSASTDDDDLLVYALRVAPAASAQVVAEYDRLVEESSTKAAEDWRMGLLQAVSSIATLPLRCRVAPEDPVYQEARPGPPLRVLPYRRGRGPVWRILFCAEPATEDDPPTVYVRQILHGAQAPMTEWPGEDEDA